MTSTETFKSLKKIKFYLAKKLLLLSLMVFITFSSSILSSLELPKSIDASKVVETVEVEVVTAAVEVVTAAVVEEVVETAAVVEEVVLVVVLVEEDT